MTSRNYHVYGSAAAMEFSYVLTREKKEPTVMIDLAPRPGGPAHWDRKIQFQPTPQELPAIAAVFMGYVESASIKRGEKWIEFIDQGENIFAKGAEGHGKVMALPISPGDRFHVGGLLVARLEYLFPGSGAGFIMALLRSSFAKTKRAAAPVREAKQI